MTTINDYIRRKLQITGILDKIDEYRRNWFQHLQRMPQNHTSADHKKGEKLEDRRNLEESSCNFGFGTYRGVQSLMFVMTMMMMMMMMLTIRDNLSVSSRTRIRKESRITS